MTTAKRKNKVVSAVKVRARLAKRGRLSTAKRAPIKSVERGMIDVDRFFGALPHLKGDTVRIQRWMRNEW